MRFLILEMALIVFAVVLGLAVTDWGANRRDRDRARAALERIRMELERNAEGLAAAAPYYSEMREHLDSILREDGDTLATAMAIQGWRGLSPPSMRRASFDVAIATGALEHVDYGLVDAIAQAYDVEEDLSESINVAIASVIAGELTRVSQWQVTFSVLGELATSAQNQTVRVLRLLPAR